MLIYPLILFLLAGKSRNMALCIWQPTKPKFVPIMNIPFINALRTIDSLNQIKLNNLK